MGTIKFNFTQEPQEIINLTAHKQGQRANKIL